MNSDGDRYVVLGLSAPRSGWFADVARWATTGTVPLEFVKCVSSSELEVRIQSGRQFSAALVDTRAAGVDRDLLAVAEDAGVAVIAICGNDAASDWLELGARSVLPPELTSAELLATLGAVSVMVPRAVKRTVEGDIALPAVAVGSTVAVLGAGGAGVSTIAMAIAEAYGSATDPERSVVLVDGCRRSDQAMLHDVGDLVPGIQEASAAFQQRGSVSLRDFTFDFGVERGYHLMLGLRRPRYWAVLRRRAMKALVAGLASDFDLVVWDLDADTEGEDETGSIDIEERNMVSRTVLPLADVVVVVGRSDAKGVYSLSRLIRELIEFGVDLNRVLPVFNIAPRRPSAKSGLNAALSDLLGSTGDGLRGALFMPRRGVDRSVREGKPLPHVMRSTMYGAVESLFKTVDHVGVGAGMGEPVAIRPGSLGVFGADESEDS
ncbi:MAG: hypothetical protein KDB86_00285 [Actinobacteria bacterium]|nr:hypothetical protein [Actinomycetota bacterium]MCB9388393.1 hypothetical protein [Acidimicrobiia bacterium]